MIGRLLSEVGNVGIIRVAKNSNYVVMNRTALNDNRLSWKAKGIMAYMLSMPDDWVFYMDELMTHAIDGKDSFRSGFNELKECGYVERKPIREGQRIKEWETIVHEVPINSLLSGFQDVEKQEVGFQEVENPPLLSTDINQVLNKPNTDNKKNMSSKPDSAIPYERIIDYLNQQANTNYRHTTKKTKDLIKARFNEGFTAMDFKIVIDKKVATWLHDPKMNKFLRPETLFGTKFESYLNEKVGVNNRSYQQSCGEHSEPESDNFSL